MAGKMKRSKTMSEGKADLVLVLITGLVMLLVAYPLYYVVIASFSNPYDVYAGKTFLLPSGFSLKAYAAVFADATTLRGYLNSVKYTIIGTVFSVVMLYITAYPLAQKDLPGRKALSIFFIITMYFGGGLVPTYLIVKDTGLLNNMWALFLPGGVGVGKGLRTLAGCPASPGGEGGRGRRDDGGGVRAVGARRTVDGYKGVRGGRVHGAPLGGSGARQGAQGERGVRLSHRQRRQHIRLSMGS